VPVSIGDSNIHATRCHFTGFCGYPEQKGRGGFVRLEAERGEDFV
jgi:hypothetical protein